MIETALWIIVGGVVGIALVYAAGYTIKHWGKDEEEIQ